MASCSSNQQMFAKFLTIARKEMADVKFIFGTNNTNTDQDVAGPPAKKIFRRGKATSSKGIPHDGDNGSAIEILASRKILAASSPVFNGMFNGEFKESRDVKTVDVKIEDVSAEAFREFLQIFYNVQVKLTTGNLDEVMKLIDKYDVDAGWPHVDTLFEDNLATADILWGLHLAVKYRRDNLIKLCADLIEENSVAVCDMIEIDDNGKPKLRSNPNNRPLTDTDLAGIYSRVYASINKYAGIISLKLQRTFVFSTIDRMEDISFSSSCTLLLTHITFSPFSTFPGSIDVNISIANNLSNHTIPSAGGTIKYLTPIRIQANQMYTVQTKIIKHPFGSILPSFKAYKAPKGSIQVAPDIQITFAKAYYSSIIAAMKFIRYDH